MTVSTLALKKAFLLLTIVFGCIKAQAVIINYELNNLGGNHYEYVYTVINDDMPTIIDQFTVYFDYSLYDNLEVLRSPVDWDTFVAQRDDILGFPEDGFFDALAFDMSLKMGEMLSGFSVSFDWLGPSDLLPAEQYFELFDMDFNVIASGTTKPAPSVPMSAPSALSFVLIVFGLSVLRRSRHQFRRLKLK